MNEHDLERIARQLGEPAARLIDTERVATKVVERLRSTPPGADRPIRRLLLATPLALRIAAAVVLLVTGGVVTGRLLVDRTESVALGAPFLPDLSADQLTEVLDSLALEAPLPDDLAVGLSDLTEEQLRELLKLMEG
jgi:hypothetical protein